MPPAESLRGLGPLTQKHLRGLVLLFLGHPTGDDFFNPLALMRMLAHTVATTNQMMNRVLVVNVHGPGFFQHPKEFPKQMLDRSFLLKCITSGPHEVLLPASPLDWQHFNEWREAADYAATTLSMLAGIIDLEAGFKSPLLGESQLA
jgi:hypothetical protein